MKNNRPQSKDAASLLTIGSFLLTIELLCLHLGAFLLTNRIVVLTIVAFFVTVGAFLLAMGSV